MVLKRIRAPFDGPPSKQHRYASIDGPSNWDYDGQAVVVGVGGLGIDIDGTEDLLYEVMKHLDAKSLVTCASVSKKWKKVAEDENLWERVCTQHWPALSFRQSQSRSVVIALGGFRLLYGKCLLPLLSCGGRRNSSSSENSNNSPQSLPSSSSASTVSPDENGKKKQWSADEVNLSLALFSIDCYERLGRRRLKTPPITYLYAVKTICNRGIGEPLKNGTRLR